MYHVLSVHDVSGKVFELPAQSWGRGTFYCEHPRQHGSVCIAEIRLVSELLECPVRFILQAFTLSDEAGEWEIRRRDRGGEPRFVLEYRVIEQDGQRLRSPVCMHWNHRKCEMESD